MSDTSRDLRMQADHVDTALAMRIAETEEARQRLENELLKVWHSKWVGSQAVTHSLHNVQKTECMMRSFVCHSRPPQHPIF
jgi:hypothetical protein